MKCSLAIIRYSILLNSRAIVAGRKLERIYYTHLFYMPIFWYASALNLENSPVNFSLPSIFAGAAHTVMRGND